jgi:hypothetical protein
MIHIELSLHPTEVEKFTIFQNHVESLSIDDLSSQDKQTYLDMISLVGNTRIRIDGISDEDPIIVFRENMFEVNEDMSISSIYPVEIKDYTSYNNTEKTIINNFIDFIIRIKS